MGKGFNNYMTKKFFHPSSKENIKRVWMAQQKTTFEKKKQEDLMNQYQKEQEMLSNRALLGDEKAKLGLSFLYDAPPGMKKKEKEEGEPEYKFEWQRKYNAPREAYAKDDETIRDQPFGIEVRNVRCIKCRQWGHVNTDKICPLFGRNLTAEPPQPENSTASLLEGLREEGFQFKQSVLGKLMASGEEKQMISSDDEEDPEVQFLKSLTPKQKKKLLKKISRLQEKGGGHKIRKNKKDKKKKKSKRRETESEDSDSNTKRKKKKTRRPSPSSSEGSDSESDDSNDSDSDHWRKSRSIKHQNATKRKDLRKKPADSESEEDKLNGRYHFPVKKGRDRSPIAWCPKPDDVSSKSRQRLRHDSTSDDNDDDDDHRSSSKSFSDRQKDKYILRYADYQDRSDHRMNDTDRYRGRCEEWEEKRERRYESPQKTESYRKAKYERRYNRDSSRERKTKHDRGLARNNERYRYEREGSSESDRRYKNVRVTEYRYEERKKYSNDRSEERYRREDRYEWRERYEHGSQGSRERSRDQHFS